MNYFTPKNCAPKNPGKGRAIQIAPTHYKRSVTLAREQLESDVETFLANGGQIQHVETGQTGLPGGPMTGEQAKAIQKLIGPGKPARAV